MSFASKKIIYISIAVILALAISLTITDHTKNTRFHDGGIYAAALTQDAADKSMNSVSPTASAVATLVEGVLLNTRSHD